MDLPFATTWAAPTSGGIAQTRMPIPVRAASPSRTQTARPPMHVEIMAIVFAARVAVATRRPPNIARSRRSAPPTGRARSQSASPTQVGTRTAARFSLAATYRSARHIAGFVTSSSLCSASGESPAGGREMASNANRSTGYTAHGATPAPTRARCPGAGIIGSERSVSLGFARFRSVSK